MILPIYAYGQPVLKKKGIEITPDYKNLKEIIENMWETMYNAKGIGLAAPQVGKAIRLFLVDTQQMQEEENDILGIKQVFINAQIIEGKILTPDYKHFLKPFLVENNEISRQEGTSKGFSS